MLQSFIITLLVSFSSLSFAQEYTFDRVPYVFTGDSPAYEYWDFPDYRYKKDSRDSRNFREYYLDLGRIELVRYYGGINRVHMHIRDIARDGLCPGQCFRIYVFLNGDLQTGEHVATFVASPGTGNKTLLENNKALQKGSRRLTDFEQASKFSKFDMYRIYGSKDFPSQIPNMPNAMFYRGGLAVHGSFATVDGNKRSEGCTRMFPDESYFLHSLVIEAQGNATFDVLHTR